MEGTACELTQREFEVLKELLTHQGRILTRQNFEISSVELYNGFPFLSGEILLAGIAGLVVQYVRI